jgi:putative membrane protein
MMLKHLLASAALIGLLVQPALAQDQATTQQKPAAPATQPLAQEEMEFATKAAQGGLKEVKFGELAQQQAARDEVKQFGQRMVDDHGKAADQLKQIAQNKGIELPQQLSDEDQEKYAELQQKSGAEFDQAYTDEMVSDHEKDVDEFQKYVDEGKDADLIGFAEQSLPMLKEHLQLAQQTQEQASAAASQNEQQPQTRAQPEQAQTAAQPQQPQAAPHPGQAVSLEAALGSPVVNTKGDQVGKIEDVVLDQTGKYFAVVSVGGFLGIGDKDVAVPLDELQLGENETYLMTAATEDQLKQMPEYDENQYQPHAQQ